MGYDDMGWAIYVNFNFPLGRSLLIGYILVFHIIIREMLYVPNHFSNGWLNWQVSRPYSSGQAPPPIGGVTCQFDQKLGKAFGTNRLILFFNHIFKK